MDDKRCFDYAVQIFSDGLVHNVGDALSLANLEQLCAVSNSQNEKLLGHGSIMKLYADSLSVELQFFCTSDINPCEVEGMKSVYRQNIHLPCHKILTINSIHS